MATHELYVDSVNMASTGVGYAVHNNAKMANFTFLKGKMGHFGIDMEIQTRDLSLLLEVKYYIPKYSVRRKTCS